MKVEKIAELCHEINKIYCELLGDTSQKPWSEAPDWQRESCVNGVIFHLNNETTPEMSHVNWMKEKLNNGWVFGEFKDIEKKTHPCLVPYNELPKVQQAKDSFFHLICTFLKDNSGD